MQRAYKYLSYIISGIIIFAAGNSFAADQKNKITEINGLGPQKLWLMEDHSLPVINLKIIFKNAGAAYDPKGKSGLSNMLSEVIDEGAGGLNNSQFKKKLEESAIDLSFSADRDNFYVDLRTLSENKEKAFDLMGKAIISPEFASDAINRVKSQIQVSISQKMSQPDYVSMYNLEKNYFKGHPYSSSIYGEIKDIGTIGKNDLKSFLKKRLVQDEMLISVVGDVTETEIKALFAKYLSAVPKKGNNKDSEIAEFAAHPEESKVIYVEGNFPQAQANFSMKGVKYGEPDFFAAYVLNYIIGGGIFDSRLMKEVRVKKGLAYSVYTYLDMMTHAGVLKGGVGTRKEEINKSMELIINVLEDIKKNGVTKEEVVRAKNYLIGSFPMQMDSNIKLVNFMSVIQMENLGIDYLEKRNDYISSVTSEQVSEVAKKLINPDKMMVVVVGADKPAAQKPVKKIEPKKADSKTPEIKKLSVPESLKHKKEKGDVVQPVN